MEISTNKSVSRNIRALKFAKLENLLMSGIIRQLRARRALTLFNHVPLITKRAGIAVQSLATAPF